MGTAATRNTRTAVADRHTRGFTILELMIVVSIIGVLAAFAFPAFGDLIKNSRRTTVVNEISSSFMLARAEAAKRGQPVSVCGLTSGNTCGSGTTWDAGLRVFLDPDNDGEIASSADVLRQ